MSSNKEIEASEVLYSLLPVAPSTSSSAAVTNTNNELHTEYNTDDCDDESNVDVEDDGSDIEMLDIFKEEYVEPQTSNNATKINIENADKMVTLAGIRERFDAGCGCRDRNCFRNLNADNTFKHRLNLAELTREEHDMYLMGLTTASLANPDETSRHKQRIRNRANYVSQGHKVCLNAFVFLENVTIYQLKRIRSHLKNHGVTPRVHGNIGKKPHNAFPLDTYKSMEQFLKDELMQHRTTKHAIVLSESRFQMFNRYLTMAQEKNVKTVGFSTFRHFMAKQFPNVKFDSSSKLVGRTMAKKKHIAKDRAPVKIEKVDGLT